MKFSAVKAKLPSLSNSLLAIFSAILLTLAFPDFELWFLAYIALIPLFCAIEREKDSFAKSFITGWIFGITFFTATCWWLTFAPITYGGVPAPLAYILLLGATSVVGLFSALFAGLLSLILKRFGNWGIFLSPFLLTAIEFLRFWITGNNWNAIAYSQAFNPILLSFASIGGIYLTGFFVLIYNTLITNELIHYIKGVKNNLLRTFLFVGLMFLPVNLFIFTNVITFQDKPKTTNIIAIQPNVPMSGLKYEEWKRLRERHVQLAEKELQKLSPTTDHQSPITIVIFPESPMNFGFTEDREFQEYLRNFTNKNNVEVLFNAAEPSENKNYYNSAVLVNEQGRKIAQYDKIHLVPFGEYVPLPEPLASFIPSMVGNFEIGKEYDIVPLGDVKAGIMICFESHFPTLSRRYALDGADVIVEMTNDGYLGPTPIIRQHLANAIFRAVETNRPILRVTNVGITGYINERGQILDATKPYTEDSRVWSVSKSDGSQTFYVKYGDWFAWLCSLVSLAVLLVGFWKGKSYRETQETQR
ncbi:MAG TPA: apolipoprotein N-acyltransferase [Pyrinomonadaceae bacterium]|nr:apolipoprotein N-acyltransferase [Pyrinomonadaceae bacterium]